MVSTRTPPAQAPGARTRRQRARSAHATRRGWALVDVIIGGVILAIGLAAVIGLSQRSLAMQQRAEREIVAAQLLDGLLNEVLATGPVEWLMTQPTDGRCDEPFDDWEWSLAIVKQGLGDPYRVTAVVTDGTGSEYMVDTLMAPNLSEEEEPERAPATPIDRQERYDQLQ